MFKRFIRILVLAGLCAGGLSATAENLKSGSTNLIWSGLRAERYGSLYTNGETVKFITDKPLPETLQTITGIVYSADGLKIDEKTIDGTDFKMNGWTWLPSSPGFYEIEFNGRTADGKIVSFQEQYFIKADKDKEAIVRSRYAAGVVPRPVPMKERSQLFGFSNQLDELNIYPLADMLGLSFARMHAIGWGSQFTNTALALEPEQGKYNWTTLDKHVNEMKKYGFTMIGNILYTPKWASPHPERGTVNICVLEFSSYAPAKMSYLEDFLKALIAHYGKDIKIWEIWNEPSIKGGSCFWADTPENYVLMLKTASETLRREQPGTELWLGGVGNRPPYYRFYRIIAKLGAAQYYDKLALHGKFSDPQEYLKIDQELGLKTKPLVSSESHDVLQREGPVEKNEAEIAATLVQCMLMKIKYGHERIAIFEFRNQAEIESLPFYGKHSRITHASGLFRSHPLTEPRLCAIVYANLINQFKSGAKITGEYRLKKESLDVVQIDINGQAPILLLWNTGKQTAPMPEQLRKAMTGASAITDWEGKTIEKNNPAFAPGKFYYISALNPQILKLLPRKEILVSDETVSAVQTGQPSAIGGKVSLLDPATGQLDTAKTNWIDSGWNFIGVSSSVCPNDFHAKYAIGSSTKGLDLVISVKDRHEQYAKPGDAELWNYDSVQFAFDTRGRHSYIDTLEFAVASVNGEPLIIKTAAPLDGDLPVGFTPVGKPVKNAVVKISRVNGETLYRIHLEWSELFPYVYSPEKVLPFSLLVNNNNGAGRLGWLEWGGGIGRDKNAGAYGNVYFVNQTVNLLGSSQFIDGRGWYCWIEADARGKSSIAMVDGKAVVTAGGPDSNGLANINNIQLIRNITLQNEQTYLLRFKANATITGNISIEYMMGKSPWPRFASSICNLSAGERDYFVTIRPRNTQSLSADAPVSLRLFFGDLPAGTVTLSNVELYLLNEQ
jgi:hypothetical protein